MRTTLNPIFLAEHIDRLKEAANINSLPGIRGYLKPGKANGMIMTLASIPDIYEDWDRLLKYVNDCLNMEGFNSVACEHIAKHLLVDHLNALRNGEYITIL